MKNCLKQNRIIRLLETGRTILLCIDAVCLVLVLFCGGLAFLHQGQETSAVKRKQQKIIQTHERKQILSAKQKAWIELEGTAVSHPVMQGRDNQEFLRRDPYGNAAVEGSLFLDARCAGDFSDPCALIYGHHMENHLMFGDLDLYRQEQFFRTHDSGTLQLPEGDHSLYIFAVMNVKEDDPWIFDPERTSEDIPSFLEYCQNQSLYFRGNDVTGKENSRILALSTCSSEAQDERLVVLAVWNSAV